MIARSPACLAWTDGPLSKNDKIIISHLFIASIYSAIYIYIFGGIYKIHGAFSFRRIDIPRYGRAFRIAKKPEQATCSLLRRRINGYNRCFMEAPTRTGIRHLWTWERASPGECWGLGKRPRGPLQGPPCRLLKPSKIDILHLWGGISHSQIFQMSIGCLLFSEEMSSRLQKSCTKVRDFCLHLVCQRNLESSDNLDTFQNSLAPRDF